jgi:AcrR family transcriptional regulator
MNEQSNAIIAADDELSPRERRHQRTQQAILTAAREIIAAEGVDKLSMRAIAERIDYSPAGLYEYYAGKDEIIAAVVAEGHRTLKRYLAQVPRNVPSSDYLADLGMAYIRFATQNPDYFLLMFTNPATQSDRHKPADHNEVFGDMISMISMISEGMISEDSSFPILLNGTQRAVEAGAINFLPGMGLEQTAYAFWTIAHGAAMLQVAHLHSIGVEFTHADREIFHAFGRGLSR